jgi:hypothetical protein
LSIYIYISAKNHTGVVGLNDYVPDPSRKTILKGLVRCLIHYLY